MLPRTERVPQAARSTGRVSTRGADRLIGEPTGSTWRSFMPLITPAADAYQATAAVAMPIQPPILIMLVEFWKLPITRTISVASRVRNTRNTAMLTWVLHNSMYVLKIANANTIHPRSLAAAAGVAAFGATSRNHNPSPIQNPPYVENAVAPNTFRLRNSHMPASSWMSPP